MFPSGICGPLSPYLCTSTALIPCPRLLFRAGRAKEDTGVLLGMYMCLRALVCRPCIRKFKPPGAVIIHLQVRKRVHRGPEGGVPVISHAHTAHPGITPFS